MEFTERQRHEIEYHREHAREHAALLREPFSWDVLQDPARRWWNAYWRMFDHIMAARVAGQRALVVGCGFGDDALRLAKLGAEVHAFDLSPDSLAIARALAEREGLSIDFREMPAEKLAYEDDFFDLVLVRDILHHVDIPRAMAEIRRVARPGALFVASEIYSHSFTERVRRSRLVDRWIYPRMQRFIYGSAKPYITEDERKLTEIDVQAVVESLASVQLRTYFNFLVTRVMPHRTMLAMVDRLLLRLLSPVAHVLGGRVLLVGRLAKRSGAARQPLGRAA